MKKCLTKILLLMITITANITHAGVMFGSNDLSGGYRWNADAMNIAGVGERSLAGGLRYSLQGGSFTAYRDLFSWQGSVPSEADFSSAVQGAFDVWSSIDPVTGLGTDLSFVADLNTNVQGVIGGGVDIAGAEIDLFGVTDASFWNPGDSGLQGETWFSTSANNVTLTSGTTNYGAQSIAGADLYMNSNSDAKYTLDVFVRLLIHELGHALGFGDVESNINSSFIDDNFDASDPVGTLNNSWADLVDVYNPSASPLAVYNIGDATSVAGVDILMESRGLGISTGNPLGNPNPLTNDEYGIRQFLYPFIAPPPTSNVSEPHLFILFLISGLAILSRNSRKAAKNKA